MIKRILRELAKLENNKLKLVEEQAKTQKQIDDVDVKIKEWNILKKEYEKLAMEKMTLIANTIVLMQKLILEMLEWI